MKLNPNPNPNLKRVLKWIIIFTVTLAVLAGGTVFVYKLYYDKKEKDELYTTVLLYFRNAETLEWTPEERLIKKDKETKEVEELLNELRNGPVSSSLIRSVPEYVETEKILITSVLTANGADGENKIVEIPFTESYNQMPQAEAADCIVSLVWSLTGLPFISGVHFYIGEAELSTGTGVAAGLLNRENVHITAQIPDEAVKQEATLYFADEAGLGLKREVREIAANISEPVETFILRALIDGPATSGLVALVPKETKIISVKTDDILCYVDLSVDFLARLDAGSTTERLCVASIVNALTERQNIKKVQFLIDGDRVAQTRGGLDLSKPFERMPDVVLE
ncbi:hypothetical protein FACS189490_01520 [Clostridia bacterium]|nr:hypothetical protein FACS189490_01520 [Clostridia bacterium]